jgi:hypothetical protein
METVNEYRVKISVRNNLLLDAVEGMGYASIKAFAETNRLNYGALAEMVALKRAPINKNGEFSVLAKQLMEIFGAAPSDLWSDAQLTMELKQNFAERVVGQKEFVLYYDRMTTGRIEYEAPEEAVFKKDLEQVVQGQLETISPREMKVLCLRFGIGCEEHSLEQVAEMFTSQNEWGANGRSVTRERIRQIEAKALRKLKHPSRSDIFRDAAFPTTVQEKEWKEAWNAAQIEKADREWAEKKQAAADRAAEAKQKHDAEFKARHPEDASWVDHLKRTNPSLYAVLKQRIKENVEQFFN